MPLEFDHSCVCLRQGVADCNGDKLYAYDLEDKTRLSAKDFNGLKAACNSTGNTRPVPRRK